MKLKAAASIFIILILFSSCLAQLDFTWYTVGDHLIWARVPDAADIDGDGDIDILGCGELEFGPVRWWANDGNYPPQFTTTVGLPDNIEDEWGALHVHAADVDSDGDNDILAVDRHILKYWTNDGQNPPNFTAYDLYMNEYPHGLSDPVYTSDMDNDDDLDIVLPEKYQEGINPRINSILLLENTENDSFIVHLYELEYDGIIRDLDLSDLDGDGDIDIVFNTKWMNNLGLLEFEEGSLYISTAAHVQTVDLDIDNDIDVLGGTDAIVWGENDGLPPPSFISHDIDENRMWLEDVIAADLDLDGDMDLVEIRGDALQGLWGTLYYWLNDGEMNFTEYELQTNFWGPRGPNCLKALDIDLDGDSDFVATAGGLNEIAWFENHLIDAEIEPFHLESPEPGFTTPDTQVVLVWNQAIPNFETGITYHIKCHNDPDSDEIIAETTDTTFIFTGVTGTQYFWDVKAVADNGLEQWAEEQFWHFTIVDTLNSVDDPSVSSFPTEYAIQSVYPNPFNASTKITIALPQPSYLSLQIFNTTGQKVSTIADGQYNLGYHDFVFNGSGLSSGIYFVQALINPVVEANRATQRRQLNQFQKILLIK